MLHNSHTRSRLIALTAQCLYVLTDDNPPAAEELRTNGSYTSVLLSIAQGQPAADGIRGLTLKVLATGTLRNISPLPPLTTASIVDIEEEIVLPLLQPLLTSISLPEVSQQIQALVEKQVCNSLVRFVRCLIGRIGFYAGNGKPFPQTYPQVRPQISRRARIRVF